MSDSRGDEPAEANARPRRETAEEAPGAGPAGAGNPRVYPGIFGSTGTSLRTFRDIPEHRDDPGNIPGYSGALDIPTGIPDTPGRRDIPGSREVLGHTVEQHRDPLEEHPGTPRR
ncbi:hypothetical protein EK904_014572 [Melospiza melodia maxima]|nr:hypothetical protein EK904_014572 [Melospiza melodia maxima]